MFQPEYPMRTTELHAALGQARHQELLREAEALRAQPRRPGLGARVAPLLVHFGDAVARLGRRLQATATEHAMRGRAVHG